MTLENLQKVLEVLKQPLHHLLADGIHRKQTAKRHLAIQIVMNEIENLKPLDSSDPRSQDDIAADKEAREKSLLAFSLAVGNIQRQKTQH